MYKQHITNNMDTTNLAYIEDNGYDLVAVYYTPDDEITFNEFGGFDAGQDPEDFIPWDVDNQSTEIIDDE